jgi:hypothetical protein
MEPRASPEFRFILVGVPAKRKEDGMPKQGLFAQVPDELRMGIKIAAIREQVTVRELVTRILKGWLEGKREEERENQEIGQ